MNSKSNSMTAGTVVPAKPLEGTGVMASPKRDESDQPELSFLQPLDSIISTHGTRLEQAFFRQCRTRLIRHFGLLRGFAYDPCAPRPAVYDRVWEDLNVFEKDSFLSGIIAMQRHTLSTWVSYLTGPNAPFPLWFKVYAWQGVVQIGTDELLAAVSAADKLAMNPGHLPTFAEQAAARYAPDPFPALIPAALARTFAAVADYNAIADDSRMDESRPTDAGMIRLVRSENFRRFYFRYAAEYDAETSPDCLPDHGEKMNGRWQVYRPGMEQELARVAASTPWSIADPGTARYWFASGMPERKDAVPQDSKVRFLLYESADYDASPRCPVPLVCIRLGSDGRVAEICGTEPYQRLDTALIPIVREMVASLPGGEEFLPALLNQEHLDAISMKADAGRPFTASDLDFLFCHDITIPGLDPDGSPEIARCRRLSVLLESGTDISLIATPEIVEKLSPTEKLRQYDLLSSLGADPDIEAISAELTPSEQLQYFSLLKLHGAGLTIDQVAGAISSPAAQLAYFDDLIEQGYDPDINHIASRMTLVQKLRHFPALHAHGAALTIDDITTAMTTEQKILYFRVLRSCGSSLTVEGLTGLVRMLEPEVQFHYYDLLREYGIRLNLDELAPRMYAIDKFLNYRQLRDHGVKLDINDLVLSLSPAQQIDHLTELLEYGANLNLEFLVTEMRPWQILQYHRELTDHGIDISLTDLCRRIRPKDRPAFLRWLLEYEV